MHKVVFELEGKKTRTLDDESVMSGQGSNVRKLTVYGKEEGKFKITVYFPPDTEEEPISHETTLALDHAERKLVTITFGKDKKIRVSEKQRNPDIR